MGLKLMFLLVSRAVSALGLSRRELWWKDAEILMLRHQLAEAQDESVKLPEPNLFGSITRWHLLPAG